MGWGPKFAAANPRWPARARYEILLLIAPHCRPDLADGSGLAQVVTQYALREDPLLLGALNLPIGSSDTEFGGIETGVQGTYLPSDLSLFAQLNRCF